MNMAKIAHLITRLIHGGADENTMLTVEGQLRNGHEVTIVVGEEYDDALVQSMREKGAAFHSVPLRHFSLKSAMRCVRPLAEYLRGQEFDIVHTHETEMGIVGRLAARRAGVPFIVHTVHGVPFSPHRPLWLNTFVSILERYCARFTDAIITNSDSIREEYLRRRIGRRRQYVTVHSGIDLRKYARPLRPDVTARPTITIIARLAQGKGHGDLLKAVARLRGKIRGLRCMIVGDGERRDAIALAIARLGLNKTASILGHREDIPAILAQTTVLALPAYWEGTPRAITEAMAAGVPVVATPVGGIAEQVEHGVSGYLVPVKDPLALADAIEKILQDSELAHSMGAAGRHRAKQFSKEAMVHGIEDVYDALLRSHGALQKP